MIVLGYYVLPWLVKVFGVSGVGVFGFILLGQGVGTHHVLRWREERRDRRENVRPARWIDGR